MGQTREQKIIKQLAGAPQVQKLTPIATDMFIPNHSGITHHPEFENYLSDYVSCSAASATALSIPIFSDVTARILTNTSLTITDGIDLQIPASGSIDMNNAPITELKTPSASTDAATKAYVDQRKYTKVFYIESPTNADNYPICFCDEASTVNEVWAETDTGTVDFNIEKRAHGSAESAGTNIFTSDVQADDDGYNTTTINSPTVSADYWLFYCSSAVASSPTKLWIVVKYTLN